MKINVKKISVIILILICLIMFYYVITLFECNAWMKAFPIQCKAIFDNEQNTSKRINRVQNNTTAPHCSFFGFRRTITIEYQKDNINILSHCRAHRIGSLVIIDDNGNIISGYRIINKRKKMQFDFRAVP